WRQKEEVKSKTNDHDGNAKMKQSPPAVFYHKKKQSCKKYGDTQKFNDQIRNCCGVRYKRRNPQGWNDQDRCHQEESIKMFSDRLIGFMEIQENTWRVQHWKKHEYVPRKNIGRGPVNPDIDSKDHQAVN